MIGALSESQNYSLEVSTPNGEHPSLDERQHAAELYLKRLQADPERVKRLCGWDWIQEAHYSLPPAKTM